MTEKLLPCPFCGGEAEVTTRDVEPQGDPWYGQNTQTFIVCTKCGACLFDEYFHDGFTDEREAIAAWNRRADHLPDATKMVSNADRIRAMSDEELARWLVDATVCERVCGEDECCHGNECVKRVTDWLQQPAKEKQHETD